MNKNKLVKCKLLCCNNTRHSPTQHCSRNFCVCIRCSWELKMNILTSNVDGQTSNTAACLSSFKHLCCEMWTRVRKHP